jgi:hypothetical protein
MNLPCPHCQKPLNYDAKLAGRRFACPDCKRPVLVPQLQALPPEIQEEYRQEVEEAREKQEAALRKQQEAELHRQRAERNAELRRQQAERDAELRRQQAERDEAARVVRAEANRRQLEQIRLDAEQDAKAKAEWKAQVNVATNEVPEEAAITNRYPALQSIAVIVGRNRSSST